MKCSCLKPSRESAFWTACSLKSIFACTACNSSFLALHYFNNILISKHYFLLRASMTWVLPVLRQDRELNIRGCSARLLKSPFYYFSPPLSMQMFVTETLFICAFVVAHFVTQRFLKACLPKIREAVLNRLIQNRLIHNSSCYCILLLLCQQVAPKFMI